MQTPQSTKSAGSWLSGFTWRSGVNRKQSALLLPASLSSFPSRPPSKAHNSFWKPFWRRYALTIYLSSSLMTLAPISVQYTKYRKYSIRFILNTSNFANYTWIRRAFAGWAKVRNLPIHPRSSRGRKIAPIGLYRSLTLVSLKNPLNSLLWADTIILNSCWFKSLLQYAFVDKTRLRSRKNILFFLLEKLL